MHATIRRTTAKTGPIGSEGFDTLKRRIEEGFLPLVQEIPGFHCYYAINAGEQGLFTVSLFEDAAGTAESSRRAAEFVRNDPLSERFNPPEILAEGELMVMKEAPVGAH